MTNRPTFNLERDLDASLVVGIDEAGCGPWAGPVAVACVIFPKNLWDRVERDFKLNDSKKLTAQKRHTLFDVICQHADYGIGEASVAEIDDLNIVGAVALATHRSLGQLQQKPTAALVDGIRNPKLNIPTHMIVQGDSKSCSIAAASILAKVTRDRLMAELSKEYPMYGWERNAGYGTKMHQEALKTYGITPHHRRSYKPIQKILLNSNGLK